MSYDVIVFDPETAPRKEDDFFEWLDDLGETFEGSEENIPDTLSANLRAFYDDLRRTYEPVSGPHAYVGEIHETTKVCEYFFGEKTIDLAFGWQLSSDGRKAVLQSAIAAKVGVYMSSDEDGPAFDANELIKLMADT